MQPDVITTHGYLFNIRALTRISFHDVRANLHAIRATFSSAILETDQDNTTHQRAVEIYIFFFKQLSRTIRPRPTTNNFHSTQSCLLEKSFWHRIRRSFENGARRRVDVQRFSRSSSARRALTLYSSPTET